MRPGEALHVVRLPLTGPDETEKLQLWHSADEASSAKHQSLPGWITHYTQYCPVKALHYKLMDQKKEDRKPEEVLEYNMIARD